MHSQQKPAFVCKYGKRSSVVSEAMGDVKIYQRGNVPTQSRPEGFVTEVKAHW